jgi:hypothetical protein
VVKYAVNSLTFENLLGGLGGTLWQMLTLVWQCSNFDLVHVLRPLTCDKLFFSQVYGGTLWQMC